MMDIVYTLIFFSPVIALLTWIIIADSQRRKPPKS